MAETLSSTAPKPRRGRPPKTDNQTAFSEEAFRSQLAECRRFRKEFQDATDVQRKKSGAYRSALKLLRNIAKSQGVEMDDIGWLMTAMDREPQDIDRETARRNRLAVWAGVPLGTVQLGLFPDGTTVATAAENGKAPEFEAGTAEEQAERGGYTAAKTGHQLDDNPYPADTEPTRCEAWIKGFKARLLEVGHAAAEALDGRNSPNKRKPH